MPEKPEDVVRQIYAKVLAQRDAEWHKADEWFARQEGHLLAQFMAATSDIGAHEVNRFLRSMPPDFLVSLVELARLVLCELRHRQLEKKLDGETRIVGPDGTAPEPKHGPDEMEDVS